MFQMATCDGRKCTSVLENGSEYSPMLNNGVPPIVVSRILGHAKPSITLDLYGHLYHEMLGEAAKIMDELVTLIKVELPSNEVLDDKLHQSAPENANLPSRQVRKWAVLCVIIPRRRRPRCDSNAQPTD